MRHATSRWCLLAIAGVPLVLGISAQALSVRLDGDDLHISAPSLHFLTGKPLERLKDGNSVRYFGQLTVSTGVERTVQARSVARFAFSYDIWTEKFKVVLVSPVNTASARNLSAQAAEAWCLDQLRIGLVHLPADRPIWVRFEIRSEDPRESDGIVGDPGISLTGLIAVFSHPLKNQQVRVFDEIGPLTIADLRKARS